MSRPGATQFGGMLKSSASGATFLIIIQLTSRLITFAANQLILRKLSPAILGIATQFELYLATILFFSRESIRVATQRLPLGTIARTDKDSTQTSSHEAWVEDSIASQSVVNVSYLSLGMGIPLAMALSGFYVYFAPERVSEMPYYHAGVATTAVASLLELGVEPFFAVVQQRMLYKKRAAVEMSAAFMKSLVACGMFIWASRIDWDVGVFPFALGYFCHSLVLICGYVITMSSVASKGKFSFLPTRLKSSEQSKYLAGIFSCQLVSLAANVFLQSAVKHLLTQGDLMILAAMSSLEDQGIYSLASNYGGLVARIIFQPIEESSRTLFSSLLNSRGAATPNPSNVNIAKTHLVDILRVYGLFSIIVFPLAPSLMPQILHLLGGGRWNSLQVDHLLMLYCYYIPFLAFNGITEAFVSSAASRLELRKQTKWMGAFSASFVLAAYIFLKIGNMGAQGLVWANIVNMTVRIVWSYFFINSYLHRHQIGLALSEIGPGFRTFMAGTLVTSITFANSGGPKSPHGILRSMAFSTVYVIFVIYFERAFFLQLYTKARQLAKSKTAA